MYSVELSTDLVQIQVRERVSEVFLARIDIPIQVWYMVEVMRRDFNEHRMMQIPMAESQLGEVQMMEDVAEQVGMNYHNTPDSRYVAQPVEDFLFPWEEAGSAENPMTKVKMKAYRNQCHLQLDNNHYNLVLLCVL